MNDLTLPDFLKVENRDKPYMPPAPKPLVHSYSSLNTYDDVCPHQYWHRYVLKDIKFVETEPMRKGNEGHTAFEHRLQGKKPFPPHLQHCEAFAAPLDPHAPQVEQWFGITAAGQGCSSKAPDVWLRGKLDCIVVKGEQAALFDWKFGSSKYEKPFELELGALLLKAAMPQLRYITGRYVWVGEKRMGDAYNLSDFQGTWRKINKITQGIAFDLINVDFTKKRSGLCGYCPVKSCEHNTNAQI